MENKVIEKCDEEINVEEIMKKIRENICRRQVAGDIYPDSNTSISFLSLGGTSTEMSESHQRDLAVISSTWDIQNTTYFIRLPPQIFRKNSREGAAAC